MAWTPSTNFEADLLDLQSNFNFVHGQLAYEANQKREKEIRGKRETEKGNVSKTKQIRDSLAVMERIQQIAGTRPVGHHATMADWEDESTVEQEAVAMMRHFGMMSMAGGSLAPLENESLPQGKIYMLRNGNKSFPVHLDPSYFEPGRKRKTCKSNNNQVHIGSSLPYNTFEASEQGSLRSNGSYSHLNDNNSRKNSSLDIPYEEEIEAETDKTS